jgi:hypothetical protein
MRPMRSALALALASILLVAASGCAGGGCPATCGGRPRRGFVPAETAAPAPAPAAPVASAAPTAPAAAAAPAAPAAHGGHGEHHGTGLPAELDRFHAILAPRWHAEAGPARHKETCAAVGDFQRGADDIGKAAAPAGVDAAAWKAAAADLDAKVDALAVACPGPQTGFDAAFSTLHDAYHHIVDIAHPATR